MKRFAALAFGLAQAFGCGAEEFICHLLLPSLARDGTVELNFSPRAEWDFSDLRRFEDMYIRQGEVLYIPWGKDTVEKRSLRLSAGESIKLFRPHEGCLIEAVSIDGRAGVFVKWGMSLPGPVYRPTTREKFLSANDAP